MNNPNLEIGTRIKNARAQLHITQTDLARKFKCIPNRNCIMGKWKA